MLNIRRESFNWKNLKFIFRPWDVITLIRGKYPQSADFERVIERCKKEIKAGFKLLPEHAKAIQELTSVKIPTLYRYFQDLKKNTEFYIHLKTNIIKYGCAASIYYRYFCTCLLCNG